MNKHWKSILVGISTSVMVSVTDALTNIDNFTYKRMAIAVLIGVGAWWVKFNMTETKTETTTVTKAEEKNPIQ